MFKQLLIVIFSKKFSHLIHKKVICIVHYNDYTCTLHLKSIEVCWHVASLLPNHQYKKLINKLLAWNSELKIKGVSRHILFSFHPGNIVNTTVYPSVHTSVHHAILLLYHWAEFNQTCYMTSPHGKGVRERVCPLVLPSVCQSHGTERGDFAMACHRLRDPVLFFHMFLSDKKNIPAFWLEKKNTLFRDT